MTYKCFKFGVTKCELDYLENPSCIDAQDLIDIGLPVKQDCKFWLKDTSENQNRFKLIERLGVDVSIYYDYKETPLFIVSNKDTFKWYILDPITCELTPVNLKEYYSL